MVAASRLRRAQERIQQARPFANEMLRVLNSLATRVDSAAHPLLDERTAPRAGGKALLFVITADRGLCGSFNTNAIKGAGTFIVENPAREVALGLIGRRGRDYFARRGFEVRYEQVNLFQALQYSHAQRIARGGGRGVHDRPGRQRLSGLQRVPLGHVAARSSSSGCCRSRGWRSNRWPAARRRSTTSTSRRRRSCSPRSSRATSRCRCSARCSSRTPRSTPRR